MDNIEFVPVGRIAELSTRQDADLLLIKQGVNIFDDYKIIKFSTRKALEEFNKHAKLTPVVFTIVPKNMVIYRHQKEVTP